MTHDLRALTVARRKQSGPSLSLLDEAREGQVSQGYIALASLVLEHAPEWVEPIGGWDKILIDAYEIAAQRQKQALADKAKSVKPNLTNLAAGKILAYKSGSLSAAESRHTS
jgi:hypothetical protein